MTLRHGIERPTVIPGTMTPVSRVAAPPSGGMTSTLVTYLSSLSELVSGSRMSGQRGGTAVVWWFMWGDFGGIGSVLTMEGRWRGIGAICAGDMRSTLYRCQACRQTRVAKRRDRPPSPPRMDVINPRQPVLMSPGGLVRHVAILNVEQRCPDVLPVFGSLCEGLLRKCDWGMSA